MSRQHRPLLASACAVLALAALSGPLRAADTPESPERGLTLDAPSIQRLGVATMAAAAANFRAEVGGFGQVMGPDATAQTDAELATAEAADKAGQSALTRARGLYNAQNSVSRQALEAAERQAAEAAAQLSLAQGKAAALWGARPPWSDGRQRSAIAARIARGEAVIVRASFPAQSAGDAPPAEIRVQRLDAPPDASGWRSTIVWAAPADPAVPGRSVYALIEGSPALAAGEHVRALLPTGPEKQGAIVPTGAVILAEGRSWFYLQDRPDHFEREPIDLSHPAPGGYFTTDGARPGVAIVTEGAGHLLAREVGAPPDSESDD